jgi:hypothetical protein
VDSTPERRLSDAFNRKELQELVTIGDKSDANIKAFVLELETVYQILDSVCIQTLSLRPFIQRILVVAVEDNESRLAVTSRPFLARNESL